MNKELNSKLKNNHPAFINLESKITESNAKTRRFNRYKNQDFQVVDGHVHFIEGMKEVLQGSNHNNYSRYY